MRCRVLGTLLSMVLVAGTSCEPSAGTSVPIPFLDAELTREVFGNDSRCRFILRFSTIDELEPVTYTWEIDHTRSVIPSLPDTDTKDAGVFFEEHTRVWEWTLPDNGSALILQMRYGLRSGDHEAGGLLRTYCP